MFDLLLFTICNKIYNFFDKAKEANLYKIKSRWLRSQKLFIGIDIDDIENLEELLTVVLIISESSGGELTRNINENKKSDVLQAYKSPLCDKCCRRGYFFNKQVEYCESVR